MFLQETHFKTSDILCIKPHMSHIFHSKFSDKMRGSASIVHKRIRFEPTDVLLDAEGCNVVVSGTLQNTPVILVSVYAPKWDDDQFFTRLFAKIPNTDSHRIIMGVDFNLVQDLTLDRFSPSQTTLSKSAGVVSDPN